MVATGLLNRCIFNGFDRCGKKERKKMENNGDYCIFIEAIFFLKFKRKNNLLFKYMLFKANALKVKCAGEEDIFKAKKHFNS